jgi:hypothetical protein
MDMITGILRLKFIFLAKIFCFKYTSDVFSAESSFDASCHGTIQIIRAQVQNSIAEATKVPT